MARKAKKETEKIEAKESQPRAALPQKPSALVDTRVIYCGDNLEQLKKLPDGCVDLIYIDPPFNSNRNYEVFWGETKERRAFEDRHASTQAYIEFMRPRCVELHRVLKKTGSFYYHCDWHASHYVKIMLDQIFGEDGFHNEITWKRTHAHNDPKQYGRNSDRIFFYTKSEDYVWNAQYTKYDEDYIKDFFRHEDDKRKYQLVVLTGPKVSSGESDAEWKGYKPSMSGRSWSIPKRIINRLAGEEKAKTLTTVQKLDLLYDNKYIVISKSGIPRFKQFLDEMEGVPLQEIWIDIPPISSQANERLGYPTQKPLALLDRIIKASSNPNDIVLDAFCGCGTALVAAENLGRQWIGIDVSPTACRVMAKRLRDVCHIKEDENLQRIGRGFIVRDLPWSEKQLREIPPFEFENWAVIAIGGRPNKAQVADGGIDGRIYPVSATPTKKAGELDFMDVWYPIQVKQKDKVGSPDVRDFEGMMTTHNRTKGFFVSFDYSEDAMKEIDNFFRTTGKVIIPLTVKDILEEQIACKLK